MKILLIGVYNYIKGGSEAVCFNTGSLLQKHGHKVVYFTLKWEKNNDSPFSQYFPESKETQKPPFKTIKNIINYFYHFEAAKNLQKLINQEKPDIAHIHLMWGQLSSSILPVLKRNNIPIVYSVHDYRLVCPAYTFRNGFGKICEQCNGKNFYHCITNKCTKGSRLLSLMMATEQYFRNIFFHPAKYINGFIYVSHFARNIQEKYMPEAKNIPAITLYNSTDYITSAIQNYNSKYLLFFGRLSFEKGIKNLIHSLENHPDYVLKIVGTGPLEDELKSLVKYHNINNIQFLGYKQGAELRQIVSNAYFVVVPSEWYENNPMTIIESYSVGTPVIGADIGGIPEIIIPESTGFIFRSGDSKELASAIEKAYSISDKQYSLMRNNAISFAKSNFDTDSYYNNLINFYHLIQQNYPITK